MNLSEKLKTFIAKKQTQSSKTQSSYNKASKYLPLDEILGANIEKTPYGQQLTLEKFYSPRYKHCQVMLSSVLNISPEILSFMAKDRDFYDFDFARALFIDTETTGLAGGTGTLAFLIGVGYFQDNGFKVVQYFMRDYDEEAAVLWTLGNLIRNFDYLVSFNGKSYDVPLLSTRYMLNRMESPLEGLLHLDLLSSARRLYKNRFESVSLSSLEKNLLSLQRQGDVPGYEIPSVYFQYLKDKNPYPLKPIFYHNQIDILSMVSLAIYIAKNFQDPLSSNTCSDRDFYCLGRVFEDMGEVNDSIKCYGKALEIVGLREKAYVRLSLLYKRLGKWDEAEKLWIAMVEKNINSLFALIELAKYYEHKLKDFCKAKAVTQRALEIAYKKKGLLGTVSKDEIKEIKKRLNRIKDKEIKANYKEESPLLKSM